MTSGDKKRVLVLCTGNSCRSQMAEGWVNHLLGAQWEARSAGTAPAPVSTRSQSARWPRSASTSPAGNPST